MPQRGLVPFLRCWPRTRTGFLAPLPDPSASSTTSAARTSIWPHQTTRALGPARLPVAHSSAGPCRSDVAHSPGVLEAESSPSQLSAGRLASIL